MKQLTVNGMVISTMPIGEYDVRLVLLTKEKGKITAFARGARRMNSSFLGANRAFAMGEFSLYPGRDSYTLTGVKISEHFENVIMDLDKVSYGSYLLEIANYYGMEGINARDTLNLLYFALKAIESGNIPYRLIRAIYELRTLVINGEYPDVFHCASCGKNSDLTGFSFRYDGCLCNEHIGDNLKLSNTALCALQFIISGKISKLFSFSLKDEYMDEVCNLISKYFKGKAKKDFRSLSML
ncbi:DNA repair protein RecO [uncultured Eubacterium sp.]|uniref:DNA repair protein RecO n=1 Tax=uncultured Eubacterium sp. TaxID=165185 RepID=UPI00259247A5|nr:DNA repair protein RecO [uncultured Eubacterium sp.]